MGMQRFESRIAHPDQNQNKGKLIRYNDIEVKLDQIPCQHYSMFMGMIWSSIIMCILDDYDDNKTIVLNTFQYPSTKYIELTQEDSTFIFLIIIQYHNIQIIIIKHSHISQIY